MNQIQGNKLLKNISDADTIVVLMAEYNTLRDEILKRIELMHQVTSLGLLVPSTQRIDASTFA